MPRPIPVDLILHTLVESLLELPEDHLRDLARAISAHCIDPRIVADQWCDGAGVASSADWIRRRLDRTQDWFVGLHIISAETRAMEVAIARRLADVGLAMLVTQNAEDRAAASLLLDASRLVVGLERIQAGADNGTASTIANLREMRNAAVAENDQWREWAKTIAGIPSSNNPHDETLRDAVEKRIIAAETAPRPAHESLVASLRNDFAKIATALRLNSDTTVTSIADIIARATLLADEEAKLAVMSRRPPSERLSWVARFNSGNGGASISIDNATVFVTGDRARELSEALYRHQHVLKARTDECSTLREKLAFVQANSTAFVRERDKAYGVLGALGWALGDDGEWTAPVTTTRPTFKPGDRVVVARKADSKSCPWSNSDDEYLGRTAEVLRVDGVGDVFVAIYDDRAWFAPACLDPAPPDTRTMRERLIDRGLDPATIDAALETKLPQFIAPAEETERPQFKVGDRVRFKPQTKTGEHPSHGDEGCIDRVDDADSRLPFRVKWFALSNFATWHRPGHLTLITPTA